MTGTLVYLGRDDAQLHEKVRAVAPNLEIVSKEQLNERPELLPQLEIAYGRLNREQLIEATNLRWLQTMGAGVNSLITPEVRERDLLVTNASGIHAEPITEHMFGMLLVVTRCLHQAWEQQKTRQWRGFDFNAHLQMLAGKTLGLLGVGAIGGHAARVGQAFGMKTVGLRRGGKPHPHVEAMFTPDQKHEFFSRCDVVMNTLPLTESTRDFMGEDEFKALPQGAIVINTGRGATMNTDALLRALNIGHLGAALLDVADPEPLPSEHPLWTTPNVFITPHYSGGHPQYNERADAIFLENLERYLSGEPLLNVVNKREGY